MRLHSGLLRLFIFIILVVQSFCALSQDVKDTSDIYHRIHRSAQKHRVTRWIYEGIFENPEEVNRPPEPAKKVKTENPYLPYKGKVIRRVRVISLDPFGYSVNDTSRYTPNGLEHTGNRYHINSRDYVIRNLLLFEEEDELDPLELSESERLLRLSPYVNDARIYIKRGRGVNSDSVDIVVVVQDKWSTIPGSSFRIGTPDFKITEKNLFGIGHQLEEGVIWNRSDNTLSTAGKYSIANIANTFITSSVFYSTARENNVIGASVDRPFYSPLAKWAGGASFTRTYTYFSRPDAATLELKDYDLHYKTQDVWVAKSFPFTSKKNATINDRSKRYIAGLRYYTVNYFLRPSFEVDPNRINRDQTTYLANAGFSKRKYYKDQYLFRFGANEDIPEGYSAEIIQGTMKKELSSMWYYTGVKLAAGKHFGNFGYLSTGVSFGTFYDKSFTGSGVINMDFYHFSNLLTVGSWYLRHFSRMQLTQGVNRMEYESVNINGSQMYGFNSPILYAKSKAVLNLELVLYAPYEILGFKFAPILLCGLAKTGLNAATMVDSHLYKSFAFGLMVRNEHLITNTFEISIGLYPYVPGNGSYLFSVNPVSSYGLKARDFNISKATLVPYE